MGTGGTHDAPTLRDYLQIVRRRKLIILLTVLATPAVADGALYLRSDRHLWKIAKP